MNDQSFDLKTELKSLGMTQKEFASFTDVHINSVSRWVRGELKVPKWVYLLIKYYKKAKAIEELSISIK